MAQHDRHSSASTPPAPPKPAPPKSVSPASTLHAQGSATTSSSPQSPCEHTLDRRAQQAFDKVAHRYRNALRELA